MQSRSTIGHSGKPEIVKEIADIRVQNKWIVYIREVRAVRMKFLAITCQHADQYKHIGLYTRQSNALV